METRYLIVNADDFGQNPGINRGVIEAHECGIVTSASLMVRWPGAEEAAAYGRNHAEFSLGLHLDLGEWVYTDGCWLPLYERVALDNRKKLAEEVADQLEAFRELTGRDPTHLDSHQHVHLKEPVRSAVVEAGNHLGVPMRHLSPHIRYCGSFYGQTAEGAPIPENLTVGALIGIVSSLSAGITELGCHPGYAEELETAYRLERLKELRVLCSPTARESLAQLGIKLCSFNDASRMIGI